MDATRRTFIGALGAIVSTAVERADDAAPRRGDFTYTYWRHGQQHESEAFATDDEALRSAGFQADAGDEYPVSLLHRGIVVADGDQFMNEAWDAVDRWRANGYRS